MNSDGDGSKPCTPNIKIVGKWIFIPLKLIIMGFDPSQNIGILVISH